MISIIIPIYNVDKYLTKCLNSICQQTYKDWEALLIDDGSTDKSGEICDLFAAKDQRFKVIHQRNTGLSEARNTGLKNAAGDFVCFVDGDDYIHPRFLELTYDAILKYDADLVFSIPQSVDWEEEVLFDSHSPSNIRLFSQHELFVSLFYIHKKFHSVAVWNKLFRKAIVNDIFFENTKSEDVEYLSRVYHRVQKGVRLDVRLYFYVKRSGSITSDGFTISNLGEIETFLRVLNNLYSTQKEERAFCLQQLYILIPKLKQISKNTEHQKRTRIICKEAIQKTIFDFLRNPEIPFRKKLGLLTFNYIPFTYDLYVKNKANRQK